MSNEAKVVISQETRNFAEVFINGSSKGKREINGHPTLREFAQELANEYGVGTFNVTVDGASVTKHSEAEAPVRAGSSIGINAKDSRATRWDKAANMQTAVSEPANGGTEAPAQATEGHIPNQPMQATEPTQEPVTPSEPEKATEQVTDQTKVAEPPAGEAETTKA